VGTVHRPQNSGTSKLTLGVKVFAVAFPIILGRPREKKVSQLPQRPPLSIPLNHSLLCCMPSNSPKKTKQGGAS